MDEAGEHPDQGVKDNNEESAADSHTSLDLFKSPKNVIDNEVSISSPQRSQSRPRLGARSRTRTRPHAPTLSSMPVLSDLSLHSPSNIVGTPFTVNAAPFEYPFPPNTQSSDGSNLFPPLTPPSLLSASLSLSGPTVALSTSPPFGPDARSYSPTHPKMRTVDPPVPPGLAKKRQRWSLTLTRRENSFGSQSSEGSTANDLGTRSQRAFSLDDAPPVIHPPPTRSSHAPASAEHMSQESDRTNDISH